MIEHEFGGLRVRETGEERQVQPDEFYLYGAGPYLGHMPATSEGPSRGEFKIVVPSMVGSVRPTVVQAAEAMEQVLRDNDWKGGWEKCDPFTIQTKLWEEIRELEQAWYEYWRKPSEERKGSHFLKDRIKREGADVQNVVMMVIDLAGGYTHGDRKNGRDGSYADALDKANDDEAGMNEYGRG